MENSAEFYYEKLKDSINPGTVLASLYCTLYSRDVSRSEIIMFNKLLKIFGRFTIFFSILDMVGSKPSGVESPYGYLYEICKRKFEAAHGDSSLQARESLDGYIKNLDKEIKNLSNQHLNIPSSKGLEPDGRE